MSMMIFKQSDAPAHHKLVSAKNGFEWFTWSDHFRSTYRAYSRELRKITIGQERFQQYPGYNFSYTIDLRQVDRCFLDEFMHYAHALFRFTPGERIMFFHGLIDRRISGKALHTLFALLRSTLVQLSGDKFGALYIPANSGKDDDDFPLHCDVFIPRILFNVFDRVPADGSGSALFLSTHRLCSHILPQLSGMPPGKAARVAELIHQRQEEDSYPELLNLLYGEEHSWTTQLTRLMRREQLKMNLTRGEAYMLNDRLWMHGRDKTNGGVSARRLHRLVFDNFLESSLNRDA